MFWKCLKLKKKCFPKTFLIINFTKKSYMFRKLKISSKRKSFKLFRITKKKRLGKKIKCYTSIVPVLTICISLSVLNFFEQFQLNNEKSFRCWTILTHEYFFGICWKAYIVKKFWSNVEHKNTIVERLRLLNSLKSLLKHLIQLLKMS